MSQSIKKKKWCILGLPECPSSSIGMDKTNAQIPISSIKIPSGLSEQYTMQVNMTNIVNIYMNITNLEKCYRPK